MKKLFNIITILALAFTSCLAVEAKKIKVACVGDSITYGFGIIDREQTYPKQLGRILGFQYDVQNFGLSGTTVLNLGNKPYVTFQPYRKALDYQPDIVVIMLGTNDSKQKNMVHIDKFENDLANLVKSFQSLRSSPKVYLCLTVPAFIDDNSLFGINGETVINEIIPRIKKTAINCNVDFIDLFKPLSNKGQLFPDKIHPNEDGAKLIAETISKELSKKLK